MPDGTPPGPSSPDHPKPEGFPDEPSGGWAHPDQSSYPPPGPRMLMPVNGSKLLTGGLSALVLFLGGWVWSTNVELTELRVQSKGFVTQVQMTEMLGTLADIQQKVDIVYDRVVLNPDGGNP